MGLIKAFSGAIRSELADQWKEYFYCDSMPREVLLQKGVRRNNTTRAGSSNTKGSPDIITEGSVIAVNEGQAMLVVEQGKIVDFTCEPGAYTFDASTEPSMFAGNFGKGLTESFRMIGKRFTFGGDTGNNQRVYYINTKEILENKYGSSQPMPYDDPYYRTVLYIRYYGMFSFRITDPLVFYNSIAGNVTDRFSSDSLLEQSRSEFLTAFDSALNRLSGEGVKFSGIPSRQMEIANYMNDVLDDAWKKNRGIEIIAVSIEKITPDDKSRQRIEDFDNAMMLGSSPGAMQGRMTAAQAAMFENMGKQNGGVSGGDMMGAVMGMMGMGMMNNMMNGNNPMGGNTPGGAPGGSAGTSGGGAPAGQSPQYGAVPTGQNAQPVPNQQAANAQQPDTPPQANADGQPSTPGQAASWTCSCGAVNTGKFCPECGKKRPFFRCDKCGWKPEDQSKPPKFCPECGDRFDDADVE